MQIMKKIQMNLFKGTMLIILFFGSIGPIFRSDDLAKYIALPCVVILAMLAARAFQWRVRGQ